MHRSRGGRKYVLLVTKTTHVFARRSGNFELFRLKKKRFVQRGGKFVLLVNKTMHDYACIYICKREWQF